MTRYTTHPPSIGPQHWTDRLEKYTKKKERKNVSNAFDVFPNSFSYFFTFISAALVYTFATLSYNK